MPPLDRGPQLTPHDLQFRQSQTLLVRAGLASLGTQYAPYHHSSYLDDGCLVRYKRRRCYFPNVLFVRPTLYLATIPISQRRGPRTPELNLCIPGNAGTYTVNRR